MSHPIAALQACEGAHSAPARRADSGIRTAAGLTVVALAGIADAISYSHMRELAAAHGETGWQAHTFPLSVDGIEIVASLVLLADRRTGRSSGWLPWAALAAGTTASLAANVAAAGADLTGRVVVGWPAFALLVAVKLLSQLLEPRRDRSGGEDRPVPSDERRDGAHGDGPDTRCGNETPDGARVRATKLSQVVPPAAWGNVHVYGSGTGTLHRGDVARRPRRAGPVVRPG